MQQFTSGKLRSICIANSWFTDGSITQYNKLFELNNNGASLEELALVIYICSSNATQENIIKTLKEIKDATV